MRFRSRGEVVGVQLNPAAWNPAAWDLTSAGYAD